MMDKEEFEKEISVCFQLPYHYLKDYGDALYSVLKSRENEGDLTNGKKMKKNYKSNFKNNYINTEVIE